MGKPTHKSWDGFTQVRGSKGTITKALCNTCKKVLVKRDAAALEAHK